MELELQEKVSIFNKVSQFFYARPLLRYSLRRVLSALITLFLVLTTTFLLLRTFPESVYFGGWIDKLSPGVKEITINNIRHKLGLDLPKWQQLLKYYYSIIPIPKKICTTIVVSQETGLETCFKYSWRLIDFGVSNVKNRNAQIWPLVKQAMPVSFKIGAASVLLEILIGYPLGVMMARYKGKLIDKIGTLYIILVDSVPAIVYYYIIYFLILKSQTFVTSFDMYDKSSYIAPIVVMTLFMFTENALWIRRYMVDEMNADYVKFARAKGLTENKIMFKHILRNAVVPFVRTIPTAILGALTGSYFIEKLFNIPGIGSKLISALQVYDNNYVQALVFIYTIISTTAILLGDIVTALLDPRIKLTK